MEPFFEVKDINPLTSMIPRSESARRFPKIANDAVEKLGEWREYLEDTPKADQLVQSGQLFDLVQQSVIDDDCRKVIEELDIPDESKQKVFSIIRTIITIYSKSESKNYKVGNGWVNLLSRLVDWKKRLDNLNKLDTYVLFKNTRENYVPEPRTHGYVLRLLLMYHDPKLCNVLDNEKFPLDKYTEPWVNSLFAGCCVDSVRSLLWKYILSSGNPYTIFFVILSIIITKRDNIIELKSEVKRKEAITAFVEFMDTSEVQKIIQLATSLDINTPSFFQELFQSFMFGKKRGAIPKNLPEYLPSAAAKVITGVDEESPDFPYFVVDCRPSIMSKSGKFISARNSEINCDFVFDTSSPNLISSIKRLFSQLEIYKPRFKIIHVCVMGSGDQDDDSCVQNVVTKLLQENVKYVSVLHGGYRTVHKLLKIRNELNKYLTDHFENGCIFCAQTSPSRSPSSPQPENAQLMAMEPELNFPGRVKQKLKQTGQEIKDQFMSCVNPNSPSCDNVSNIYEAIDAPYQSTSDSGVYGIFDLKAGTSSNKSLKPDEVPLEPQFQPALIDQWIKAPNVEKVFKCREILSNGRTYASRLIVTNTNIILLRRIDQKSKNKALLILNCPILYILKISGSSKDKDFMTISFDMNLPANALVPYDKVKLLMSGKEKFINAVTKKF